MWRYGNSSWIEPIKTVERREPRGQPDCPHAVPLLEHHSRLRSERGLIEGDQFLRAIWLVRHDDSARSRNEPVLR